MGLLGATHFDQLAKILTGYEITGARSSGIFMGILSIAVGSLFKITAVPFRAAVGRTAAYRCIASMILGALAAMAQTKVKRLLAHSSIGHVGYIRTGFSCGTIEGIQALLIGIFIYASMTIDAFAIVSALRQSRVKYIADLGALAKTNPISAITFSITMFSYAGIPPLAGFCSKFYLFFAALGCGAYFLAPVGVVTSVIGRWAAGRLPRVNRVESDTSTVYSISLYESTITTRDEPWFGELKLALGVIGLPVTLGKNGEVHPNRPMKNKRRAKRQWRAKRMRNGHGEKEGSLEEKQPSSFPSLPGPKAVQGESGASRSTVERKIFGPSSFSTGFQTFLQHRFRKGRGTQTFFAQSSITINGWLHDFLWAQASQEDLKGIMALRFPRFSQGLAQDPTTRRIWFGIATAHDFESHDDITEERLYQNIFASHFGQLAIIFLWTSGNLFHVAWQGNFESWVQDPLHVRPIAHAIWDPHFGQPAVEAFTRGGALGPVNIAYSGVYQWWYTIGLRTNEDLYTGALFLLFISAISLIAGWLHLQPKWKPSVSWFKNAESRLNHHLSGLFGVSSLAWTGHLVHVAIPASRGEYVRWNNFLDVLPHPQGLGPLFTGQWNLYAQNPDSSSHLFGTSQGAGTAILTLLGGFHPQTQSLWLTDMAHHHLAIAFIFLIAGHMYRTNFGIGHSMKDLLDAHIPPGGRLGRGHKGLYDTINNSLHFQLGLALASLGVITSLVAQHMYSLPAYAFIAQDFTTQAALYTHHQYIAGFIMTGAFAHGAIFFIRDYNPEQNEDNVLARMLEHKEAIISHLSWASLFLGFHTLGLYVHNDVMLAFGTPEKQILIEPIFAQWIQSAHGKTSYGFDILLSSTNGPAFNAGRSIWLPGWLNAINENSNSLFLTIGPGDFLVHHAIALGLHTTTLILVKGALDARGSKLMPDKKDFGYSFPCDGPGRGGTCDISAWDAFYLAVFWMLNTIGWVTFYWHWKHITLWQGNVSQFNESSTYLMGWLRDYLWLNSSQLINGYNPFGMNSLSVWAWMFLFGHLVWATGFMFLISWRGYWQELIETLAWAHERTPLANLIRWRDKPVALSIVQARLVGLAHFSVGYIFTYAAFLIASTSGKFG
ncbi:photosystem I P700 apoprotein A2 [Tanacetum coccineum]